MKQDRIADDNIKTLQDGRVALLTYTTLFAAVSSEMLLYAFSGGIDEDNIKLAIGLPLVSAPCAFYGSLMLTRAIPISGGRALMIISSSLWGSTWGLTASFAFNADQSAAGLLPEYAGLSVAGGLLYGAIATWLTASDQSFPASRAWLFNLGSVLGSFLGFGIPYLFNVEDTRIIYAGMLSGSLGGSAVAWFLTRDMTEGRNVSNLTMGSFINITPTALSLALPLITPVRSDTGNSRIIPDGIHIPLLHISY